MKTLEDWSAALTTNCECCYLDEDGHEVYPDYCGGYCYEDAKDYLLAMLEEWQRRNDYPEALLIQGRAIGWQRLAGYALVRESGSDKLSMEAINKLRINGEYTLQFSLEGNACKVVRYSHDEPTGASFTLEPFAPCQGWSECEAVEGLQEYDGVTYCAWCYDLEQANQ